MRSYPGPIDGLQVTNTSGVLELRLDRPKRRNAVTDAMVLALVDAVEVAGSDETVRCMLLTGNGDNFCSGFDLAERSGGGDKPRTGATQRQMRWHVNRLVTSMLETQTPIVCAVKGWAVGLGMNMALASDFAIAANGARFWAPFTESGFTPDSGVSWMVPRLVGVARAKEILMLGRKVSGEQAAQWGMIHQAVPVDQVDAAAGALTEELASSATVAVGLAKSLIHRSLTVDLARHLEDEGMAMEVSQRSEDFRESMKAKRDKRDPDFTGR